MNYITYIFIATIVILYIDYCIDRIRADRQAADMTTTAVIEQELLTEAPERLAIQPSPSPILNMPTVAVTEPVYIESASSGTQLDTDLETPIRVSSEPTEAVRHPRLLMNISDGLLTVKQMKRIARSFGIRHKNLRKADLQQQLLSALS